MEGFILITNDFETPMRILKHDTVITYIINIEQNKKGNDHPGMSSLRYFE